MVLALTGDYSDPGNEDTQLETCRAYCSAGYAKPLWCDELPSGSQGGGNSPVGAAIGGCAGAVVIIVVGVIVVCLYKRRKSKGLPQNPEELEDQEDQKEQYDPEQQPWPKKGNGSQAQFQDKKPGGGRYEVGADPDPLPPYPGCPPRSVSASPYEGDPDRGKVAPPPFLPGVDSSYENPMPTYNS
jgi:hypothetical protein